MRVVLKYSLVKGEFGIEIVKIGNESFRPLFPPVTGFSLGSNNEE